LVKPKDVESLYLAMKKAVEMGQEELRKMGKKGREIVEERYEISKIVSEYVKIIENVLNKKM
jgi:glycosyltransferase involved in cell wall biosynthesis